MIFWECSENYKSIIFQKPLWMVTLSCQVIFLLNQCHSMAENSGGQTMGQNTGKSDFFCIISTILTKNGGGGAGCFIL